MSGSGHRCRPARADSIYAVDYHVFNDWAKKRNALVPAFQDPLTHCIHMRRTPVEEDHAGSGWSSWRGTGRVFTNGRHWQWEEHD
eukprot:4864379-Amphidinium_carterae.1